MWKTGHSLIKEKMKETGAALVGEPSGHICFADGYYGFDDALYAACRLGELWRKRTSSDLERAGRHFSAGYDVIAVGDRGEECGAGDPSRDGGVT